MVSDCAWNPRYNMFAVCGFGQQFPVLVYVYERTDQELNDIFANGGGRRFGTAMGDAYLKEKRD
jgi:hypothetical protein